jgi:hypothetical protein
MKANVQVASNLMIDDDEHRPHEKYIPGDLFAQIYPDRLHPEYFHKWLTEGQIREYKQYLVCGLCRRTCAGTCGLRVARR